MNTQYKDEFYFNLHAYGIPSYIEGQDEWEYFESIGEEGPGPIKINSCSHLLLTWFNVQEATFPMSLPEFLYYICRNIHNGIYIVIIVNDTYFSFGGFQEVFDWGIYQLKDSGDLVNTKLIPDDLNGLKEGSVDDIFECQIQIKQ